ncbi:MAG: hypothetical protein M3P29_02190, partial [Acidobacteriota bacterium]|nr:hypothetical protein [Acidobacteriota bacterium]
MIAELCAVALAVAVGFPLARWLDRDGPPSRLIGEGALLGFGVCAAMLAILPWSRPIIVVLLLAIAGVSAQRIWA